MKKRHPHINVEMSFDLNKPCIPLSVYYDLTKLT